MSEEDEKKLGSGEKPAEVNLSDFSHEDVSNAVEASTEAINVSEEKAKAVPEGKLPDILYQYYMAFPSHAANDLAITFNLGESIINSFSKNYKGELLKESGIKGVLMQSNGKHIPVLLDKEGKRVYDGSILDFINKTVERSEKKQQAIPDSFGTKEHGKVAVIPFEIEPGRYSAMAFTGVPIGLFDEKKVLTELEQAVQKEGIGSKAKFEKGMKFTEDVNQKEAVAKKYRARENIIVSEFASQEDQDARFREEIDTLEEILHAERVSIGVKEDNVITFRRVSYDPKTKRRQLNRIDVDSKQVAGIDVQAIVRNRDIVEDEVYTPLLEGTFNPEQDITRNPTRTKSLMTVLGKNNGQTRVIITAENKEGFYTPVFAKIDNKIYHIDLSRDFFKAEMEDNVQTINDLHKSLFRKLRDKQVSGSVVTTDDGISYQLEPLGLKLEKDDIVVKRGQFPFYDKEIKLRNIEFFQGLLNPLLLNPRKKQYRGAFDPKEDLEYAQGYANNRAKAIKSLDYEARLRQIERVHGLQTTNGLVALYDLGNFNKATDFLKGKDPDNKGAEAEGQRDILSNVYIKKALVRLVQKVVKETEVVLDKALEGDNAFVSSNADSEIVKRELKRALFDRTKEETIENDCVIANGVPVLKADSHNKYNDHSLGFTGLTLDDEALIAAVEEKTSNIRTDTKAMQSVERTAKKLDIDILSIEKYKLFKYADVMMKSVNIEGITWVKELAYRMSARKVNLFGDPYKDIPSGAIEYIDYVNNVETENLAGILQRIVKCKWYENRSNMILEGLSKNIKNIDLPDEPINVPEITDTLAAIKKSYIGQSLPNTGTLEERYSVVNVFKGLELALAKLKESSPHRRMEIAELTAYLQLKDVFVVEDKNTGKVIYTKDTLPPNKDLSIRKFSGLESVEELAYHFNSMFKFDQAFIKGQIRDMKNFEYKGFHLFDPFRIRVAVAHDTGSFNQIEGTVHIDLGDKFVNAAARIEAITKAGELKTDKRGFEGMKGKVYYTQELDAKGKVQKEWSKDTEIEVHNITGIQRFCQDDLDMIPTIKGRQLFEDPNYPGLDFKIQSPLMNRYYDAKSGMIFNSQYLTDLTITLRPDKAKFVRNLKDSVQEILREHQLGKGNETIFCNAIKTEDGAKVYIENVPTDMIQKGEAMVGSLLHDLKSKIESIGELGEWVDTAKPDSISFSDPRKVGENLVGYVKALTTTMYNKIVKAASSNEMLEGLVKVETENRFYVDNTKLKMFNAAMINLLLTNQFKILEKNTTIEINESLSEAEKSNKTAYKDSKLVKEIAELEQDLKGGLLMLTAALDDLSLFQNGSEELDRQEKSLTDPNKEVYARTTLRNTITSLERMLKSNKAAKEIIHSIKQANIRYDGRNKDIVDEKIRYGIEAPWRPNVIRVAKALTNASSDRMYRRKLSNKERINYFKDSADTLFDSQIIKTVLREYFGYNFDEDSQKDHKLYKEQIIENNRRSLNPGETKYWAYSLDCGDSRPCTACELYLNKPSKSDALRMVEGVGKTKGNRHYIKEGVIDRELDIEDFRTAVTECPHYKESSGSSIVQITNKDVIAPEINAKYFDNRIAELMQRKFFPKPGQ